MVEVLVVIVVVDEDAVEVERLSHRTQTVAYASTPITEDALVLKRSLVPSRQA